MPGPKVDSSMGARHPAPFVVGVARSGTTLLRMMLDSHPELAIPPETHFAGRVIDAFDRGSGLEDALPAMLESPFWPDFGIGADEFARQVEQLPAIDATALLRCFYETYAARFGKRRWGDKTPPYLDRMTTIQRELPEAHFIHVVRDGRDVALSVSPLWFGPDDVEDAARHWSSRIAAARRQAAGLPAYIELHYEDLVRDPASSLRRVCAFIGIAWHPAMLEYHRHAPARLAEFAGNMRWRDGRTIPGSARTAIHELTAEPPRQDRIGRWRTEMSAADSRTFERISGPTLSELGYELRFPA